MDPSLAKPFIKATKDVLAAMAALEVVAGTPYIKKDKMARGDVSAVIGITGEKHGTFSISFDRKTAVHIVKQMLGDAIEDILQDVQDAVGEITNMISGQARVGWRTGPQTPGVHAVRHHGRQPHHRAHDGGHGSGHPFLLRGRNLHPRILLRLGP